MQKSLFILSAAFIILSAGNCKKNNPPVVDQGDYQPLTVGSEWNYTTTGTNSGVFKLSATSKDSTVNGRSYKVFANSKGTNEYYNKTGGDYFRFSKVVELNNEPIEILYLKDNLNKGQTWVESKTFNVVITGLGTVPVTAQFTFTVAEKGIDHVVNAVTFKDVIKITAVPVFSATIGGVPTSIPIASSDLQYFFARKVGLINSKTILSIPLAAINTNSETKINAYIVK